MQASRRRRFDHIGVARFVVGVVVVVVSVARAGVCVRCLRVSAVVVVRVAREFSPPLVRNGQECRQSLRRQCR
eukprot:12937237-Prorocentrum_lima.AAC.1